MDLLNDISQYQKLFLIPGEEIPCYITSCSFIAYKQQSRSPGLHVLTYACKNTLCGIKRRFCNVDIFHFLVWSGCEVLGLLHKCTDRRLNHKWTMDYIHLIYRTIPCFKILQIVCTTCSIVCTTYDIPCHITKKSEDFLV